MADGTESSSDDDEFDVQAYLHGPRSAVVINPV